jgi:D-serine dehydratase
MTIPTLPPRLRAATAALRERPIPVTEKGFGVLASRGTVTAASLGSQRPSLFEDGITTPVLVLRESAVASNVAAMAAYCEAAQVRLAPHGKTTMAPQLFARQLAAGAWAVTAATIGQVQVYRAFGVPRVLLANELTDTAGAAWLARELAADPGFDCYAYVDSVPGVRLLDEAMREGGQGRPLPVLVELGYPGGRTGCRDIAGATAIAQAVGEAASLRLAGAAGYEGGIGHDSSPATLAAVARYCRELRSLGELLARSAPGELILTAGGSMFFDIVAQELTAGWAGRPPMVVLRSGVYIAFDHGIYARMAPGGGQPPRHQPRTAPAAGQNAIGQDATGSNAARQDADRTGAAKPDAAGPGEAVPGAPALKPALELWAHVLSRPEPTLALACAGRRDVSFDAGLPVPLKTRQRGEAVRLATGMQAVRLDDQHCYLTVPAGADLAPGDLICLGVSHPCTTFDKWRVIPVVDDDYRVVDAIHTFF